MGMCFTASIASRFSVRLTGRPAWRSSCMNPASSSVMAKPDARSASIVVGTLSGGVMPSRLLAGSRLGDGAVVLLELAERLGDVALVLEQDVDGGLGRVGEMGRASCRGRVWRDV